MSLLTDFYYGRIMPIDDLGKSDPKSKPYLDEIEAEKERWLKKKLSEEAYEEFDEIIQPLYYDAGTSWEQKGFSYGFRLGAMMMIEILTGNENLFGADTREIIE